MHALSLAWPRRGLTVVAVLFILSACGGNAATLEEICKVLRARLPDHLMAVRDALRERDAVMVSLPGLVA